MSCQICQYNQVQDLNRLLLAGVNLATSQQARHRSGTKTPQKRDRSGTEAGQICLRKE